MSYSQIARYSSTIKYPEHRERKFIHFGCLFNRTSFLILLCESKTATHRRVVELIPHCKYFAFSVPFENINVKQCLASGGNFHLLGFSTYQDEVCSNHLKVKIIFPLSYVQKRQQNFKLTETNFICSSFHIITR